MIRSAIVSSNAPISVVSLRLRATIPSTASSIKMTGMLKIRAMARVGCRPKRAITPKVMIVRVRVTVFASILIDVVNPGLFQGSLFQGISHPFGCPLGTQLPISLQAHRKSFSSDTQGQTPRSTLHTETSCAGLFS